jgi:hypothetical protein
MIAGLPSYVTIVFLLSTAFTLSIFLFSLRQTKISQKSFILFNCIILLWTALQGFLAFSGFYLNSNSTPPTIPLAVLPAVLATISALFFPSTRNVLLQIPTKTLVLLSAVRIPVELCLFWLFQQGLVPQLTTFEGRNFDIFSGVSAIFVYWLAFGNGRTNKTILLIWNTIAFLLLLNIVINAILSLPTIFQSRAFEQPNRAVLYFPFIWLPSVIVASVFFSHIVIFLQLITKQVLAQS